MINGGQNRAEGSLATAAQFDSIGIFEIEETLQHALIRNAIFDGKSENIAQATKINRGLLYC